MSRMWQRRNELHHAKIPRPDLRLRAHLHDSGCPVDGIDSNASAARHRSGRVVFPREARCAARTIQSCIDVDGEDRVGHRDCRDRTDLDCALIVPILQVIGFARLGLVPGILTNPAEEC